MKVNKSKLLLSADAIPFEGSNLEQRLAEVQRNTLCVWRAVRLTIFLTALALAGLGHSLVLIPEWPQTMRQLVMLLPIKAHCALGLASLTCSFFFSVLGLCYRRELTELRVACGRLTPEMTALTAEHVIPLPVTRRAQSGMPMEEPAAA